MESASLRRGAWSRRLWILVASLTVIGLVGTAVDFLGGMFVASGHGLGVGCGGMVGVLFLLILLVLIILGLIALLASVGLGLFWRKSRWGPLLLVSSNLFAMGVFGWIPPVYPGQLLWAAVILMLASAPAIAVVLLVWPLMTRGRLWVRGVELVVLGLLAIPVVCLYASGLKYDIQMGLTTPPTQVASASCGGSLASLAALSTTP